MADIYGRITIVGSSNAINRLLDIKLKPADGEDTYNALVGMVWLNSDRSVRYPATLLAGIPRLTAPASSTTSFLKDWE